MDLNVCAACGQWSDDFLVADGEPALVCPACGHRRRFVRLPLLALTGPSGAGKSAVGTILAGRLQQCVVLEQDLLWLPDRLVRHLFAAYDLNTDRLYGHIKTRERRGEFLSFLRYPRSVYPPALRLAIVVDNFSPHLSTRKDRHVSVWAATNNVELAYTPTNARAGSTASRATSPRCATSPWTAPTTPATRHRAR